ncbi:MAG: acyl carrier protein [Ruminococcus sp.]|nr:acyl carrier protein [Ruminococcus sp.]
MNEQEIATKIQKMICEKLGVDPEELDNDVPLFDDGIGLDSIDSLEIIAGIDEEFGVDMTGVGKEPFYNVTSLAEYVANALDMDK